MFPDAELFGVAADDGLVGEAGAARSSRRGILRFGVNTRELRAAGGAFGVRSPGQILFSGLSKVARYVAMDLALVVLYLRTGALPAILFRHVKHVGVGQ